MCLRFSESISVLRIASLKLILFLLLLPFSGDLRDQTLIGWDVLGLICLLVQRRIFTSGYFQDVVVEHLKIQNELAARFFI